MEILKDFGVEPILLLAQIVNFVILLYLLKRFLYKPILKVLEERKKKIEISLKQAEEIQKQYSQSTVKQEAILEKGREDAQKIIDDAKEEAQVLAAQIRQEADESAQDSIKRTMEALDLEKQKMVLEARQEIASLVSLATEKVVRGSFKGHGKNHLTQDALKELKK